MTEEGSEGMKRHGSIWKGRTSQGYVALEWKLEETDKETDEEEAR
jgi:hypothetical protein